MIAFFKRGKDKEHLKKGSHVSPTVRVKDIGVLAARTTCRLRGELGKSGLLGN